MLVSMGKCFLDPVISVLYITQTSYELRKSFWGNHDFFVVLSVCSDSEGVLVVQDGQSCYLGQGALESCTFFFESFPILASKLDFFICPGWGIGHLDRMK